MQSTVHSLPFEAISKRALLIGAAAVLFMGLVPLTASAASAKPSCALTVETEAGKATITKKGNIALLEGGDLKISWKAKNATEATGPDGDEIELTGSDTFSPEKKTTYTYTFEKGSRDVTCEVTAFVVNARIDEDSLTASSGKPTISGEAEGMKKVTVSVYKEGAKKPLFKKKATVKHGVWQVKASKPLKPGKYAVVLAGDAKFALSELATGTLSVGAKKPSSSSSDKVSGPKDSSSGSANSAATLSVGLVPLLTGGTAKANASVPVSYLQVRNTGTQAATIKGFWVKQNGSANASTILNLSTVDDKGGNRATSSAFPFKDGSAFAPSGAMIEPGTTKLFTIKATMAGNIAASLGKDLKIDVTSLDTSGKVTSAFPIRGTTWTIGL